MLLHRVWISSGDAPQIHLFLAEESAIDQGGKLLGLMLCLLSLLQWIR
jgi:hypothetical protein